MTADITNDLKIMIMYYGCTITSATYNAYFTNTISASMLISYKKTKIEALKR